MPPTATRFTSSPFHSDPKGCQPPRPYTAAPAVVASIALLRFVVLPAAAPLSYATTHPAISSAAVKKSQWLASLLSSAVHCSF